MEKGKLNLSVEGKNHFCIKNASTKDNNEWWEDKFWELNEELAVPISQLNAYRSVDAVKGRLEI